MDSLAVLLGALHAHPDDDTARLALADCLEEQGEVERADLVRWHTLLRSEPEGRRRDDWEQRIQRLLRSGVAPCVPEVVNSLGMRFALIPSGSFWMGAPEDEPGAEVDEYPRHRVEITSPFYLGVFPVTQGQFQAVMGFNPSRFAHGAEDDLVERDTSSFPVESVSWGNAIEFCTRLENLPAEQAARRRYRLPTEAEWEYACRGGASSTAPTYLGPILPSTLANYDGSFPYGKEFGPYLNRTSAVGSYPPNAFGLFDMLGNVWEWCFDGYSASWYHDSPASDPWGPDDTDTRVLRGGAWYFVGNVCRSASRAEDRPESRNRFNGFRVLLAWG
jgi:uncharacterized protein (TIGR02996 family)